MKKKLLICIGALLVTVGAFAQGTVVLANLVPGELNAPITRPDGTGLGADGRAQLYLADSNTPLTPSTGFLTGSPTQAKYLMQTDVTIPGNNGTPVNLVLRFWIGDVNSTFETAVEKGESNIFSVTPGVPPNPPSNLAGLVIVPEPSTLALGLLGAAVLLFRRRKA